MNLMPALHRLRPIGNRHYLFNRVNPLTILEIAQAGGKFGVGVKVCPDNPGLVGAQDRALPKPRISVSLNAFVNWHDGIVRICRALVHRALDPGYAAEGNQTN